MSATLLWDIDGTLLTTARAGVIALKRAALSVCGVALDLDALRTDGLTDFAVAEAIVERATGAPASTATVRRLLAAYEAQLPAVLGQRAGAVLAGVAEILADLAPRQDVRTLLLTGNTAAGARAKLAHYGLDRWFADGAFCAGAGDRTAIARVAIRVAEHAWRDRFDRQRIFVIGDTPHDVACGKAVGARTVAVASGRFGPEELRACEPWRVLGASPDPPQFRRLIGLAGSGDEPSPYLCAELI
jgi:phosphoglycolate phosphatase-like HAD superfamily hydrolase